MTQRLSKNAWSKMTKDRIDKNIARQRNASDGEGHVSESSVHDDNSQDSSEGEVDFSGDDDITDATATEAKTKLLYTVN